ncbi:MAG: DNA internalization-related competence protein ComEC/Rec2, partial [Candidatus Eremiobacteraeota bacterium]|nr:DNA internalization-related competence protein ComEC/Rec2 [Candidatus Eremiobacteraeota bacterium]
TSIVVRGRFSPFDGPRNPGEPDQRMLQRERGYDGMLEGATVLQNLGPAPLSARVLVARSHVYAAQRLRQYLGEPYASILAGELWGERGAIPADLRAEFQDTGTVHILVTAGLHIGVIALLSTTLLQWARTPRTLLCIGTAGVVWAYVVFSGGHLPAIRAGTMISIALLARSLGYRAISWNSVAAAVIVVLLYAPQSLLSASFALSFSCVGAILLVGPPIDAVLTRIGGLPSTVREALTLTIATQVGVWPLTAATFLLFAPYAILANAAVVPIVSFTMILGIAQIVVANIVPIAHACANLNAWLLQWMIAVVRTTSSLPGAHIVTTPAPLYAIGLYDTALFLIVWLFEKGALTAACAVLFLSVATVLDPPRTMTHTLQITMLDVGQADSIVIRTPAGHVLLVDGGGRLERGPQSAASSAAEHVGETTVVPFLIRSGIHHIDALLLSHPHGDHAGGVAPVLRSLGTDELADSGQQYGGFAYRDAISVAHARGTPITYPRAGTVWRTNDGVTLTFLGPQLPFITGSRNDINSNSLVFMLQYKAFRMLFTGDAGAEAEQRILAEGVDLRADVLKVGHHGSAYSSTPEFISAVHPRFALISVGRHNLFGHPAPQTIATLDRFGAAIYRTDQDGALTVAVDGGSRSPIIVCRIRFIVCNN